MLKLDDMELMQLQFCMQQTKGSYTPEHVRLQLEEELRELLKRRDD